ncbi:transposase [Patescibacteria group bacterium]|nr:transposase [Patescibacteria group bacterium]
MDTINFFSKPTKSAHRNYEVLRGIFYEKLQKEEVAKRFSYSINTLNMLISEFKKGKLDFFIKKVHGPKSERIETTLKKHIVSFRKKNYSCEEIYEKIKKQVPMRTIQRIVHKEGFTRLPQSKTKKTTKAGALIPQKARKIDWYEFKEKIVPCQVAGVFLFIPYLIKMGFPKLIRESNLPETTHISKLNSVLSLLTLKLIGQERLSQITNFSFDEGFGIFAGLNVLPKSTSITSYTYSINKKMTMELMKLFVKKLNELSEDNYPSKTINLDFHTIPHFGEKEINAIQKHWAGARNKRMTGALTFLAQDSDSKMLNYCNADLKKEEASEEIINFVDYWIDVKGIFKGNLVFDSKLTTYGHLNDLNKRCVKFITLRRRGKNLKDQIYNLPEDKWQIIDLKIPKRKFNKFKVHESEIPLKDYDEPIRQIIIKDHGRAEPTFVITNNRELTIKEILIIYAKRWRIENKISELVKFFSLNALNSPIMIRIFFDVLLTLIADSLYRLFAQELKGFEQMTPNKLFSKFIDTTGKIKITEKQITVVLRRKAHSPILKSLETFQKTNKVEWLGNRELVFEWRN